ncbi:MAG TPA: STAS domain-containing protein [Solirubrobacterales bacterium]|nr:STAS domain-containing protein [Solirubrobacterales bacterium]
MRTGEIALDRSDSKIPVLVVSGEHDLNTAGDLRARLDELLAAGEPVIVDLSAATFVDSSILGVVLDARRRAEEAGLGFAVAQSDGAEAVARVLEITGLREELPVHGSRDAAGEAIAGEPPS